MNSFLKVSKIPQLILRPNTEVISLSKRGLVTFKDLFKGSKDKPEQAEVQTYKENLISTDFDAIKNIETTRLVRVKAYRPPSNVNETIKKLCMESFGKDYNEEKFTELSFTDPTTKFNVLSKCVAIFKNNIPNPLLNEIKNVGDVLDYYLKEQKDTSPLEELSQQQDLPKNLHINLEYNRFDPEKDKFFDGKDAFPERNTVVQSLWYSKKYKPVIKKKDYFSK